MSVSELRAELSSAEINDLPDSAFAYIEPGGKKDDDGKTTPRSKRHYPVQDKPHADNALSRANAALKGDDEDAKKIAKAALPKIKKAVKAFADEEEQKAAKWNAQKRDSDPSYEDLRDMLATACAAEYAPKDDEYCYVYDFGDDWVVFSKSGEKLRCSYEIDGSTVTLGDAEQVRPVTTYTPMVESKSAPPAANPATPKRAFTSLVEQPPAQVAQVQMRLAEDADTSHVANFTGYASTTGTAYSVRDWLGEYDETMMPGSFAKTLREREDIPMLFNHDGVPLASTSSSTSVLAEDATGLRNDAELDRRDALSNTICVQLERGVLNKMSFSFRAVKDAWNDAYDSRSVTEAALYDTSIVTYPANPTTSAELVEEMRSALGREGRSLWLADHELSIRSALPAFIDREDVPAEADELLERALRALAHADDVVCRSKGPHGRARTFQVAHAMLELRAGKTLSSANKTLLNTALSALSAADKQHQKLADAHAKASEAVTSVVNSGSSSSSGGSEGKDGNQGTSNGNPITPQDGAGPRAASLKLQRQREAESRALHRR